MGKSTQVRRTQSTCRFSLLLLIVTFMVSLMLGCGGSSKSSSDEIHKRLRRNADEATKGISRKRPIERQKIKMAQPKNSTEHARASNQQERLPPHVSCRNRTSCFPHTHYLVAEGLGASVREAEIDASSRLSAKISSEVSSTVRLRTSEGDGLRSKTQGEIEQTVKSNFKRGELIGFLTSDATLEGADKQSSVSVFAYLPKSRYKEELERELERPLRALTATVNSLKDERNPEVFVRVWQDLIEQRDVVEAPLVEYRAVMGNLPSAYQAIKPQLVALERDADQRRRKAHFIIELSGSELGQPQVRTLFKGLIRQLGPRVSSPGTCLRGNYLLRVDSAVEDHVHQLTGGALKKLRWGVTLYECGAEARDLREIGQRALPMISGVERYNVSAEQVVVRQLKTLTDLSKPGAKSSSKRLKKYMGEVKETIQSLVSLVVPTL